MTIYQDYLKENILKQPGLISWWPLDDPAQPYARVLTPGQAVGRNLAQNATPTSATSWTLNAGWAYASSLFTHTAGSANTVTQALSIVVVNGKSYSIVYTVSGRSAGSITVSLGASGTTRSTNATFTETIVATGTTLTFTPSSTFDGSISVFSVTELSIPTSDSLIASPSVIVDGDMETAGTAAWTALNSATLSKQGSAHSGSQCLRVAYNGVANASASEVIFIIGRTYRITGYARSDSTAVPSAISSTTFFTGTSSTSWQAFDVVIVSVSATLQLRNTTSSGYVEFDDVVVTEIHPMSGLLLNGVVQQSPALGHLLYACNFDGTNDVVNVYSAGFNSIFNPAEGSASAWVQVASASVWSDATNRRALTIQADANNSIRIVKFSTTNLMNFVYIAGGTSLSFNVTTSLITWIYVALTWSKSADQVCAYVNGVRVGTGTGLGAWAGNLTSTTAAIGASSSAGATPWSGKINDVRLYNRALSASEILAQYRKYLPQFQWR